MPQGGPEIDHWITIILNKDVKDRKGAKDVGRKASSDILAC